MHAYIVRRLAYMIVVFLMVAMVTFIIIQLPPGDYVTQVVNDMRNRGLAVDEEAEIALRRQYGLDRPLWEQFLRWFGNLVQGDFGRSLQYQQPVSKLIGERLALSIGISILTLLFTYLLAVPIGIYSATHQYSMTDYAFTVFGFVGLATPNFLLALILMFLFLKYLGINPGGLFSAEYVFAPWNLAKVIDLIKHLPIPLVVIGTAGTAGIIRVMRGSLLDELKRQYVITARAKGLGENRLLFKYPLRVALNPIVSTVGWLLPAIVSGETITAVVLTLPTVGPLLLQSLMAQDMQLAASMVMFLTLLTVIGTFVSDLVLVLVDPRIRYEKRV